MTAAPPNFAQAPPASTKKPRVPWYVRLSVLAPSFFLYLVACATPAIEFLRNGVEPQRWYGIEAMLLGWQGVFIGQYGWFANPLLLLTYVLVLFRQFVAGSVFAILAVAVSSNAWALFHKEIPADEGNVNHLVVKAFGIGFYIWLASLLAAVFVPVIGSLVLKLRSKFG